MKKGMYLFSLVFIMGLVSLAETLSGFILSFALPSGSGRGSQGLTYLGLTRHTWVDMHDWMAIALVVIVLVHMVIHWKWVVRMTRQVFVQRTNAFHSTKGVFAVTSDMKSE
jgi:hypothetical protein